MSSLDGAQAAHSDGGEPGYAMPELGLVRPAALAGGTGQHVAPGLAVQVGDPVLGDLVAKLGVHHGLLMAWLDFRR